MLYELGIENFKPFGTRQVAPLSRITLIYGPNSGGKSSVIQAILLLKQTMEGAAGRSTTLVPRGDYVDLGSFRSFIHRHDLNREFRLSFAYDQLAQRPRRTFRTLPADQNRGLSLAFRSANSPGTKKRDSSELFEVRYKLNGGQLLDTTLVRASSTRLVQLPGMNTPHSSLFAPSGVESVLSLWRYALGEFAEKVAASAEETAREALYAPVGYLPSRLVHEPTQKLKEHMVGSFGRSADQILWQLTQTLEQNPHTVSALRNWLLHTSSIGVASSDLLRSLESASRESPSTLELLRQYSGEDSPLLRHQAPLERMALEFEALIQGVTYLGPLRSHPARHYLVSGGDRDTVGVRGEQMPLVLFRRPAEIQTEVNRWLTLFEIPYKLHVKKLGDELIGEILALSLRHAKAKLDVGPSDVGFGIGQLLPIIVEGVVAQGKVICVEQPEIHLHPKLQAHIADFLIETAGARPSSPSGSRLPRTQWVVETHSEALMLRLQRRIREKRLSPDDLSVLYVEPIGAGGSRILRLRLDDQGEFIDEWPQGFFEEGFRELFGSRES